MISGCIWGCKSKTISKTGGADGILKRCHPSMPLSVIPDSAPVGKIRHSLPGHQEHMPTGE